MRKRNKPMNGRTKKAGSRLINFHCPKALEEALKTGVRKTDSDNSKFVRNAIREKLARHGVAVATDLETV